MNPVVNMIVIQKIKKYSIVIASCLGIVLMIAVGTFATRGVFDELDRTSTFTSTSTSTSSISPPHAITTHDITIGEPSIWMVTHTHGGDRLDAASQAEMRHRVDETVARLQAQQILPSSFTAQPVLFDLPIRAAEGTPGFGYFTISNYVDHNPLFQDELHLQDYLCGDRTYDADDGYNHTGTDFMPFPFPWQKMDRGEMQVVAAAAGVIIEKTDGYYDRECVATGKEGNAIILQHADGTTSWYLHLKNGSLLTKSVGDSVAAGEFLGTIGSSGRSNGPHLHFEVQDADENVIDPFFDPSMASCNPTSSESLWTQQLSYGESTINDIVISAVKPVFNACDNTILPMRDTFAPGEEVIFNVFYRNDANTKSTEFSLYLPDGTPAIEWEHASTEPHITSAAWSFPVTLPKEVPLGEWLLEAVYEERTYEKKFVVAASVSATPTPTSTFTPVPTAAATTAPSVPATATVTATAVPATATSVPATATTVPATATSVPATATTVPATATSAPATATTVPTAVTSQNPPDGNTIYLPAVTN